MSYYIRLLPEARDDIREVIKHYNQQKPQLGNQFLQQVTQAMQLLKTNPKIFQVRYKSIRQVNLKKFPFQIHYLIKERKKRVIIIAILHSSRHPDTWKDRPT